jgi:hypothetical protein
MVTPLPALGPLGAIMQPDQYVNGDQAERGGMMIKARLRFDPQTVHLRETRQGLSAPRSGVRDLWPSIQGKREQGVRLGVRSRQTECGLYQISYLWRYSIPFRSTNNLSL